MAGRLTPIQLETLQWIADGDADGDAPNPRRTSARSLSTKGLAVVRGRGATWRATITDLGHEWLANGGKPAKAPIPVAPLPPTEPAQTATAKAAARSRRTRTTAKAVPVPDTTVDSPAGKRRAGKKPRGDGLFTKDSPDPWDEKILINVKEAAWMLSLPEHAIRQAVTSGDVDRVFIGAGTKNYRIVYGSLLAWVNDMPRHSGRSWW